MNNTMIDHKLCNAPDARGTRTHQTICFSPKVAGSSTSKYLRINVEKSERGRLHVLSALSVVAPFSRPIAAARRPVEVRSTFPFSHSPFLSRLARRPPSVAVTVNNSAAAVGFRALWSGRRRSVVVTHLVILQASAVAAVTGSRGWVAFDRGFHAT